MDEQVLPKWMNKFAFDQTFKSPHINSLLTTNFYYDLYLYFRSLQEIDMETKQAIIDLLNKKRLPGLASWKQVARRYGMREKEISFLERGKNPAGAMLESLASLSTNITVHC